MLPAIARSYLLTALGGTPAVLNSLLGGLTADDPRWDAHPDPERFSLREIAAHLALIEPGWQTRTRRIRDEDRPFFERASRQNADTESRSPLENLRAFGTARREWLMLLGTLTDSDWERMADTEFMGPISVEQQAVFVLAHDGYHVRQVAEWLARIAEV